MHNDSNTARFPRRSPLLPSQCLENAKCDYEYLEKKAKWKAVTGLECNFLNFVCQLYNAPGNQDGYVFEIARREGDSIIFQKVWRSIREGLEAMNATDFKPEQLKVSPILDAPPPLSPALMEKAPKVDEESLQPLCHMVSSKILEQQVRTKTEFCEERSDEH
ncbi:hypothetical protein TL16_g06551 [Triparma laevis f. inornata]|uniref:Uncharacterized protein n=1 Tax=Triparma laevis f. inornata TaxID=1714386 RepID=A0A9W7ATE6_9STRA|nr:hypothetical protein TL16_g06551 [Triparma laevis f. inornata]